MKVCVGTVIYPSAEKFISQFIQSINEQTDRDVELLVMEDGLSFSKYAPDLKIKYTCCPANGSISAIRKKMLAEAKALKFANLVFADIDDVMASNRIEESKKALLNHEIIFNDILVFSEENMSQAKPLLAQRIVPGKEYGWRDVLHFNFMGLTNTAIRLALIPDDMKFLKDDVKAFDWALFTYLLLQDRKAFFLQNTHTYYRQHENSLARSDSKEQEALHSCLKVKLQHYQMFAKTNKEYEFLATQYQNLYQQYYKQKINLVNYLNNEISSDKWLWWESLQLHK